MRWAPDDYGVMVIHSHLNGGGALGTETSQLVLHLNTPYTLSGGRPYCRSAGMSSPLRACACPPLAWCSRY